ncbi:MULTISPECIES: fimbrial protein [unclassified Serratia (in: enterobacteria)]|uniref:fimbrial protein n=1 Tax=unclassified Serratia (in: enterobacteria) TaxID=2647522 RepID=UPI0008FEFE28|nr:MULTISPECIES: fimbrial protein [unclassified Serratia (in: enterobacteria)]
MANASWVFNTVTGYPNVIANTGAANNVGVQILDSTQTPITNGGKSVIATLTSASVYNANYYASYYSLGNPTTGTVVGNAKFSITYN